MFACSSPVMRLKTRFASSLISSVRPFQFIQWVSDFSIFSLLLGLRVSVPFAHAPLPYRRGGVASSLQGRRDGRGISQAARQKQKSKTSEAWGHPARRAKPCLVRARAKPLSLAKGIVTRMGRDPARGSVSAEAKREAE